LDTQKSQRIRRIGHIVKFDKEQTLNRIIDWRPTAVRIGRLRLRREGSVREDLGRMNIQDWRKVAMDTETWKKTVEQAKNHIQL
jgi:hypothetical protein